MKDVYIISTNNYFVSKDFSLCKGYDNIEVCKVNIHLLRFNVLSCVECVKYCFKGTEYNLFHETI